MSGSLLGAALPSFGDRMGFADPGWLAGGLVACILLLALWRYADARQQAALARFVAPHLRLALTQSLSRGKRRVQRGLYLAAMALLCVALAGPLYGFHWEQISRRGNEIIFAIDTSRSMLTPDIKPNRLERAKLAIDDFVDRLDGDAVGIVAFAGSAFLACPVTLDYGALHESLAAIDTTTVPLGGTNIASAIREAQAALHRRPGSDKILILVTDGEDLEGSALAAAQAASREDGLKIFTVGVGTASGDLIPVPAEQGGGFVKDENGAFVKSHLDEPALQAIAAATGGFYVPLGSQGEGLDTIYKNVLGPLAKHDLSARQQKVFVQRYQWPLAASLIALLASQLVGTRRRLKAPRGRAEEDAATAGGARPARAAAGLGASGGQAPAVTGVLVGAAALLAALTAAPPARAAPAAPAAASSPAAGSAPGQAGAAQPASPPNPIEAYNAGTAEYRAGAFPQAAQAFKQAISNAPSSDPKRLADQEDAYYNLGNTLYRAGQKTEQSAPQDTLQQWNDAVKAYETALQLRPNDLDSKYNRDLVKRKIAALQQQQNQQQNQNRDQKQDQKQGQGQGQGQPQDQKSHSSPNPGQGQPQPSSGSGANPQPSPPGAAQPGAGEPPSPPRSAGEPQSPPPGSAQDKAGAGQPGAGQPGADRSGDHRPQPAAGADGQENPDEAAARESDEQRAPGQMSREEARELLDSVKGDEKHPPLAPLARQDDEQQPRPPLRDW